VGGIPEVLISGYNGFLADAPTISSFGSELEKAWNSRQHWQDMGLRAHQAAKAFGQQNPAGQLYDLLQMIRDGKNPDHIYLRFK
jgi:glycosyltransferase involved in cell wall biosynthesis